MRVHDQVLAEPQRRLLDRLAPLATERGFYLAGGTAVALIHGHRRSLDFDWFCDRNFDAQSLVRQLVTLGRCVVTSAAAGTLHLELEGVRASFLAYDYPLLGPLRLAQLEATGHGFQLADPTDLTCMKLAAILQRGERKDFYDLRVLLDRSSAGGPGSPSVLAEALSGFRAKYGFDGTASVLRALVFFDDAERTPEPELLLPGLSWSEAKSFLRDCVRAYSAAP